MRPARSPQVRRLATCIPCRQVFVPVTGEALRCPSCLGREVMAFQPTLSMSFRGGP